MVNDERGKIRNRQFAQQIKDFSGLRFGNITPTDVDAMIEYHNKAFVYIELKYGNADLSYGQQLAFERVCDALQSAKPTLFIIASHNSQEDIDVANTKVSRFRFNRKWQTWKQNITTKEIIVNFLSWVDKKDLKP